MVNKNTTLFFIVLALAGPMDAVQAQQTAKEWFDLGKAQSDARKDEEAIQSFSKAIAIDPGFAEAYLKRSSPYYRAKKLNEALADCMKVKELQASRSLIASADFCIGLTRMEIEKKSPNIVKEADTLYEIGNDWLDKKKYADAFKSYSACIAVDPNHRDCYNGRGLANQKQKKHSEAILDFNKAISLSSNYPQVYFNRGKSYAALDKNSEAIADFNKALSLDAEFEEVYYERAEAYFYASKLPEAVADFNEAIEVDPEDSFAYSGRAEALRLMGKNAEAVTDFSKAIALDDQDGLAFTGRAKAYCQLGKKSMAQADEKSAMALGESIDEPCN